MSQYSEFSYDALEWDKIIHCLYNHTASDLGKKLVEQLIPITEPAEIEIKLRLNSECRQIIQTGIAYPVHGCSDVGPMIKKLSVAGFSLSVEEINSIVINLEAACRMRSAFNTHKEAYPELYSLSKRLKSHEKIVKDIRTKIDEHGTVLDTASPALKKIRRQMLQLQEDLKNRLESLMKQYARTGMLQEEHITIRSGRYVLPVKEANQRRIPGITHDISSTGATIFVEPLEIVERNNKISILKAQEEEEIRKILTGITAQLREIAPDIEYNQNILAQLDFHYACGRLAYRLKAQKPSLTASRTLELYDARHPLLLLNAEKQEDVVPLSVTLGNEFNTLVISGPNAGGKTVTLKTIGLLCLMVQCGLPVPASADSKFPVFRRIIAEIGDPQSLDDNLSTFSARLLNIKAILDDLTEDDLILLDELGTGTDPQEGVNLAMAIIKYITSRGALTVATTHHGGLKIFASETDGVENASLAFDKKSLKPTFQLSVGIPGSSYALELSRKTGLPTEIIDETRERLGEKQLKIEDFIRELESRIAFYKKKNAEIADRQQKLDNVIAQYTEKLTNLKKEYHTKLEGAVRESENRMAEFNRNFEQLVKEIREKQASHAAIVRAKKEIQRESVRIKRQRQKHKAVLYPAKRDEAAETPQEITAGSTVRMKGHDQTGVVIAENPRKNTVTVQMSSIKLEINRDRLQPVTGKQKKLTRDSIPIISVKPEIDLRGMQSDEALEAVDHYLSDAVSTGVRKVRIVHGKGTGVLRRNVSEFLKNDDRVAEFRLGSWGEGDTGVTIVQLK